MKRCMKTRENGKNSRYGKGCRPEGDSLCHTSVNNYLFFISAATDSSQLLIAWIVLSNRSSNSQPSISAPWAMTSLEHPAANFLSLNFFFRLFYIFIIAVFLEYLYIVNHKSSFVKVCSFIRVSWPVAAYSKI